MHSHNRNRCDANVELVNSLLDIIMSLNQVKDISLWAGIRYVIHAQGLGLIFTKPKGWNLKL